MSAHTSMQRANVYIPLPTAAWIKFQILVLVQKTEGISGPFPLGNHPAIHASQYLVFCHRPLCLSFLVRGWSVLHTVSTIVSPGSLMVQWPSRLIQHSSQSPYSPKVKEKTVFMGILHHICQINDELFPLLSPCLRRNYPELFCFFSQDLIPSILGNYFENRREKKDVC